MLKIWKMDFNQFVNGEFVIPIKVVDLKKNMEVRKSNWVVLFDEISACTAKILQ